MVAGAVVATIWWDPEHQPAPELAIESVDESVLDRAADSRIFFGHMSVGQNVLDGVTELYAGRDDHAPEIIEITLSVEHIELPAGGFLTHAPIGQNGDPVGKLANFDAVLRAGLADELDAAVLKFCYVDVTRDTDVESLFAKYQATLDALERDYPDVRFLRATVPVTVGPSGIRDTLKAVLRGDDNSARRRYNDLVRAAVDPDLLFDVARVESTGPDGSVGDALYRGYSYDGEHLNSAGATRAAVELLTRAVGPA